MVTKRTFWNDMNKHRNTSYRCVNNKYIVEYGHGPLTEKNSLSVWRHQKDGSADPDAGEMAYPHAWVKVASARGDPDDMDALYRELTTEQAILDLRDDHDRNANWEFNPEYREGGA